MHCKAGDAWAGDGYYFWESNEDLAIWWGCTRYDRKYLISRAIYDVSARCFDLHNSYEHQRILFHCFKLLKKKVPPETISLKSLINALRSIGAFDYDGVRFYGINSITSKKWEKFFRKIEIGNPKRPAHVKQYIDLTPAIQLCLFDKDKLNFRGYGVIHDSSEIKSNQK